MTVAITYSESDVSGCRKVSFQYVSDEQRNLAHAVRDAAVRTLFDNSKSSFIADISQAKFDQAVRTSGIDIQDISPSIAGKPR